MRELDLISVGAQALAQNLGGSPSEWEAHSAWAIGAALRLLREPPAKPKPVQPTVSKSLGFLGDPCKRCGQFMLIRTGTCTTCQGCGENSGCA